VGQRAFTSEELRRYDGRAGRAAYVACKGKVYDVSRSFLWQHGGHQVLHRAGHDLTDDLAEAPHTARLLRRFPMIGKLIDGGKDET
jgi:predicted heme/steroid binding protein